MTSIEKKLAYSNSFISKILVLIYFLIHSYKYGNSVPYQRFLWRKFGQPEYWNLTFLLFLSLTAIMLYLFIGPLEFLLQNRKKVQSKIDQIHDKIISDLEIEKEQKLFVLPNFGSNLHKEEIIKLYEQRKKIEDKQKKELEEKVSKPFY